MAARTEGLPVRARASTLDRLQAVGTATVAGTIAGMLIGLAGRIAMRISGIAGGPSLVGIRTESGNPVGDITLAGTLVLVLYVGLSQGVYGGLLYGALRPWLARAGAAAGVAFGLLVLGAFGTTAIRSANPDFRLFGPPLLNVLTFSALFVLFGVATAWLAELIDRLPDGRGKSRLLRGSAVLGLLIFAITNLAVIPVLSLMLQGRSGPGMDFTRNLLLLDALLIVALAARWLRREPSGDALTYAFVAIPVLVGVVWTVGEIAAILL